jgi:hypothetical protein
LGILENDRIPKGKSAGFDLLIVLDINERAIAWLSIFTRSLCFVSPPAPQKREELIEAARRREIDLIVVWRLDRWGRSLVDLVNTLQELGVTQGKLRQHATTLYFYSHLE